MRVKKEKRATKEQIENLIHKYSSNEKVFEILYTGKTHTLIMLEHGLREGITIAKMANCTFPVTLPECRKGIYFCNEMYSEKIHIFIVRKILTNFVKSNPQYFTLKPNSARYAISEQFVLDLLIHNKDKDFEHIEFLNLLRYITNIDIFNKIAALFYLLYEKKETIDHVKRKCWQKETPFTVKIANRKKTQENYIIYGGQELKSITIAELIKEMKLYYTSKNYHTVAYCAFSPENLPTHFPRCQVYTFEEIYNLYYEFVPQEGSKKDLENDKDSIIFPKYSIVDCESMPTLPRYKKIFQKFVAEEANRFIIFVNYHSKEVFWGAGGIGHNLYSSDI